jgi:hypothetical protein
MLEVYRFLRDAIPDISDGVWRWKRLCQSGFDVEIEEPSSEVAKRRAQGLLDSLNGLLDVFYGSLFTFGAAALEIVPTRSRESIHDVVPVDVWTVRFRREKGGSQAYQLRDAWVYADLVKGFTKLTMEHYFTPTHMLANEGLVQMLLGMSEFKDTALFDFSKTGSLPSPFGAQLVPMADQPADKLTILDAGYAIQKVTEQDVLVESDKLINQQWDRTYITVVTDFAVIYDKARVVVQSDWV